MDMSLRDEAKKKLADAKKNFLSDAPAKPSASAAKPEGGSAGGTGSSGKSKGGSDYSFDIPELGDMFGTAKSGSGTTGGKSGGATAEPASSASGYKWDDYSETADSGKTATYGGTERSASTGSHAVPASLPGDTTGYGGFTSGSKPAGSTMPVDPYAGMTAGSTTGVGPVADAEEMEEARNRTAWMNPDNGDYLAGYAATDPKVMDERQIRSGIRRWMHSFISGVPFSRYRSGTRFLLRKDELEPWEINVIIYGDLVGGYVNRGARLKVRGRRDNSSGDLIAEEIITDAGPLSGSVATRGLMSAGIVRLLTLFIAVALVFVLYGAVLLLFGAANAVAAFFRMLIQFIKLNWLWMVLLIVGFNWIRRRMRRWFH